MGRQSVNYKTSHFKLTYVVEKNVRTSCLIHDKRVTHVLGSARRYVRTATSTLIVVESTGSAHRCSHPGDGLRLRVPFSE